MLVRSTVSDLVAAATSCTVDVSDCQTCGFQLSGTFVGTITFEVSIDGTNFTTMAVIDYSSVTPGTPVTTATVPGSFYNIVVGPATLVRGRCSAFTSGTIHIVGNGARGSK